MDQGTGRRSRALIAMLVLALAAAISATAMAVDVRGTLRVPDSFATPAAESEEERHRNHYWDEWNGFLAPRPRGFHAPRDLAIVLTGEGEMAENEDRFMVANGGLFPTTLVERAGGRLQIANTDPVTHQLFAEGLEGFGETPIAPGRMRPVDVPSEGHWPIRDSLYDHVRGHLHVIPDLIARATIQSNGHYHFANVNPGTYTLKIFHGAEVIHTQEGIVVEEREVTIEPVQLGGAQ